MPPPHPIVNRFLSLPSRTSAAALSFALFLQATCSGQITNLENLHLHAVQLATAKNNSSLKTNSNPNVFYLNPGPWGRLRCSFIYIEAAQSLVEYFPLPSPQPRWAFDQSLQDQLPEIFKSAGLPQGMIDALMNPQTLVKADGNVYVFPTIPDLLAMTPESRGVLYTKLAENEANPYMVDPVLIVGQEVKEWYRTSKLRPEIVTLIEKLSYKRGQITAFSDLPVLISAATSDSDALIIFKAMTRTRSLMVKMELDLESNIQELGDYWSPEFSNRHKDIDPILQSIIDTDGLDTLPLTHLLPALPRKIIYTYPDLSTGRSGRLPDCHWTSLNFFNYDPKEYLLDERLATSAVLEHFIPVEPPYDYGDILFFLNAKTGDAFHSCIQIADNVVFTKNGRNMLSPWVLMRREDLEKIYLFRGDGRIQGYRRKP